MSNSFIGKGSITNLSALLKTNEASHILLFRGKSSFNELADIIYKELQGLLVSEFFEFDNNPKYEDIQRAISLLAKRKIDCIVAVGGGSVIDFAKAFKFYAKLATPLIAVPTTAGTGSEATQFAVVYVDGKKTSIDDASILPDYAIVDSQFVEIAPRYLKACTAMDTFCQAIESYWSIKSTDESKRYAKEAIAICIDNLEDYVLSDKCDAAERMAKAAYLSGKAINISRTTAAHALSYAITSQYGIPHGHAVALGLGGVFASNLRITVDSCQDTRGLEYVYTIMDELHKMIFEDEKDIKSAWIRLMESIGLEWSLEKLGIVDICDIVFSVNIQRLSNNPKDISKELDNIWL